MVQNQRNGTGLIPFFLILYYTYLRDKINTIFRFFVFLLKFYHIEDVFSNDIFIALERHCEILRLRLL